MLDIDKIYCGNCIELMKEIDDISVDLTVTSPPYDNMRDYHGYTFEFEEIAKELYRVTKDGGIVVWIVGDAVINGSETGTSFKQALYFKEIGFNLHDTMIYEKSGMPFPMKNRYYQSFEYMFVFSKGKPKSVNLIADRKNVTGGQSVARKTAERQSDGSIISNSAYKNDPNRKRKEIGVRFNIWRFKNSASCGDKIALKHPATFPEDLANDHIISWSNEGDLVLDPMCGSGTTCKMAKNLNRHYIGMDISEEYCKISRTRLLEL